MQFCRKNNRFIATMKGLHFVSYPFTVTDPDFVRRDKTRQAVEFHSYEAKLSKYWLGMEYFCD